MNRLASAGLSAKHTDFSEGKRFIIIHMAASYANGSLSLIHIYSKKAQVYQANEGETPGKKKSRLKFGEGESVKTEKDVYKRQVYVRFGREWMQVLFEG